MSTSTSGTTWSAGTVRNWIKVSWAVLLLAGGTAAAAAARSATSVDCNKIWQRSGSGFYESNPTYVDPRDDSADWQFAKPEDQGLDSRKLAAGVAAIRNPSLFSVLVLRNDRLVFEKYLNGSSRHKSNNIHSASKSLVRLLIGIAVERGLIANLDVRVSDLLPEDFEGASAAKKSITVRHLLTMSAGLEWTEDSTENQIESQPDWVAAILDLPLATQPGRQFNYDTGLTHVLSAVLQRTTGLSTCEFAHRYLLNAMNITAEHWGRDPNRVYSGGYNVYLTPREMAKLGLLLLHDGNWHGRQLVSSETIAQAHRKVWKVDDTFSYGQLFWLRRISGHDMYFAWGFGGQFIYVIPDYDIVLVITQDTADGHNNVEVNSGQFIEHYLIPAILY